MGFSLSDIKFDIHPNSRHEIKVVGVGGGGSNTVNHMYRQDVSEIDFAVCNTDRQALQGSPVPEKIQLGTSVTEGLGTGSRPEVGRQAADESMDKIKELFPDKTKMVFVTAGMGGGTGTGAAPIIAKMAKDLGKLTIGIVTMPFSFEGRDQVAAKGIAEMRKSVDALIIVNNNRIFEIYDKVDFEHCFAMVNEVLCTMAINIAEVTNKEMTINVDINDMRSLLGNSGTALLGVGRASGQDKAREVIEQVFSSPFVNDADIYGSERIIFTITYGKNGFKSAVLNDITKQIRERSGQKPQIIKWGYGADPELGDDEIKLIVIAAGFPAEKQPDIADRTEQQRNVYSIAPEGPLEKHIESLGFASYVPPVNPRVEKREETRVTEQGEEKVFNIYTLKMDDDPVYSPLDPSFSSVYAEAPSHGGRPSYDSMADESTRSRQRRASVEYSPLNSDIDQVLGGGGSGSGMPSAQGRRVPLSQSSNRESEPAYLRHGIVVDIHPPKEGRTNNWTLDVSDL